MPCLIFILSRLIVQGVGHLVLRKIWALLRKIKAACHIGVKILQASLSC